MNNRVLNIASDRAAEAERLYYEAWQGWKLRSGDSLDLVESEAELITWICNAGKIYKLYAEHILTSERPLLASLTNSVNVVTPDKDRTLYWERAIVMHLNVRGLKHEYQTSRRISFYPPVPEQFVQDQVKQLLKFTEWGLAGFIRRGEVPVADIG